MDINAAQLGFPERRVSDEKVRNGLGCGRDAWLSSVTAPGSAEARGFGHHHGGFGPGLAGGLIAGALIGGLASSAYAYGPGYYGYGPAYYGGYAPAAYYGGYYDYPPAYRYRRVVRPAFAFYGGPRFHRGFH